MRTTNIQCQEAAYAPETVNATSPNLEEFRYIIQTYLLPLVHGSVLDGPHRGANMENGPVSFDTAHKLNIAVPDAPDLHMTLTRPVPFTEKESALIRHIVALMHADTRYRSRSCHPMLCDAMEKAIATEIYPSQPVAAYNVIQIYSQWAAETCEGKRITHTVGMYPAKSKPDGVGFFSLWDNNYLKKLGADNDTLLAVGNDGTLLGLENISSKLTEYQKNKEILAPVAMLSVALWAGGGGKVAFRLTGDGEILIFKNKMLVFAKRRSFWRSFPHKRLLEALLSGSGNKEEEKNRLALYQTLLDLAFSRCGGCIGILPNEKAEQDAFDLVAPESLFSSTKPSRTTAMLKTMVNSRKFYEIPRKIRVNLCALDGAVVMDSLGTILTAGAIVKTSGSPEAGGGRSAAARSLARHGCYGIKISNDGYVEMYHEDKSIGGFA